MNYPNPIYAINLKERTDRKENFSTNYDVYLEGENANTCLNKKIAIDRFGNIKNCPSMSKSFGNANHENIVATAYSPEFKNLWSILLT